jgi:hypothetical protein
VLQQRLLLFFSFLFQSFSLLLFGEKYWLIQLSAQYHFHNCYIFDFSLLSYTTIHIYILSMMSCAITCQRLAPSVSHNVVLPTLASAAKTIHLPRPIKQQHAPVSKTTKPGNTALKSHYVDGLVCESSSLLDDRVPPRKQ